MREYPIRFPSESAAILVLIVYPSRFPVVFEILIMCEYFYSQLIHIMSSGI